jgi:CubicO group peptidase (beta-lactamase class C family)
LWVFGLLVLATAAFQGLLASRLEVGTAYASRLLCIGVFDGRRSVGNVLATDLRDYRYLQTRVDRNAGTTTASLAGLASREARFRPGYGCTTPYPGIALPLPAAPARELPPAGEAREGPPALAAAARAWFDPSLYTHAVLVMQDGQVVHEAYAAGIDAATPLLGWSMSKSVVHAQVGRLLQLGALRDVGEDALLPAWDRPGDARYGITVDDLLRMSSGLEWDETYFPPSDVTRMLFLEPDAAAYAASRPLAHDPGTVWLYSSGTSNLLSAIVQRRASAAGIADPARELLFLPLGMHSAVAERDAAGREVGSSYVIASARDWARFGQLYLDDGVYDGLRLLPEGWVDHARRPTPPSRGRYGAHWWLNGPDDGRPRVWPDLPEDTFSAQGHDGQYVMVVPSRRAVLVRLGAFDPDSLTVSRLMAGLLAGLPDK